MIPKMNSHDFNNMLNNINEQAVNSTKEIKAIKNNMTQKILILKHEIAYNEYCNSQIEMKIAQRKTNNNYVYIPLTNNFKGLYESYSNLTHAYFKKEPTNIFNLKSINNDEIYFRNEETVKVNGIAQDYNKNILMADDYKNKGIFFQEFKYHSKVIQDNNTSIIDADNKITIDIEIDKNKILGISKFNMIEIDPFLYKSFDIENIKIYGDDYNKPLFISDPIKSVGNTRIILDEKYAFKKVTFTINPNYSCKNEAGEKIIPFGLKHIYFYEADFRNDSYIVAKYTSDSFIDCVYNNMDILTPYGFKETTIKEQGIKIYQEFNNNLLDNEQEPSVTVKKPFSKNIKNIYFKIPILNNGIFSSLIAARFHIDTR